MTARIASTILVIAALIGTAGCANTIKGMGRDTANAVDATQGAASDVDSAARY